MNMQREWKAGRSCGGLWAQSYGCGRKARVKMATVGAWRTYCVIVTHSALCYLTIIGLRGPLYIDTKD